MKTRTEIQEKIRELWDREMFYQEARKYDMVYNIQIAWEVLEWVLDTRPEDEVIIFEG